jgi:hypothetical protein
MQNFKHTALWALLHDAEPAKTRTQSTETIIDEFTSEVANYCRRESNPAERYRTLQSTRSYLTAPDEWADNEAKRGGLSSCLAAMGVACIDGELKILEMELRHPEKFTKKKDAAQTPLARWNGTISELLELFTPVQIAGKMMKTTDGEVMAYSDVVVFIRDAFGLRIAKPYSRRTSLLNRSKGGAPFLNKLTAIYLEKVDDANG